MQSEMTFDDVQNKAIESGLLSKDEVELLKSTLFEMRRLSNKDNLSSNESVELSRLSDAFNGLVLKGAPELADYKPNGAGGMSWLLPAVIVIALLVASIYWVNTNA